jgi:DNA polymerase III subunit beta
MKIEIQQEDLAYAVSAVERAVSTKNTLPVLSGIMISAQGNRLSFRATDLEMAIECVINAVIEEEGEIVAPGRKFSQLAKGLTPGLVNLEAGADYQLQIKYSRGHISMPCYPAAEFPLLPTQDGEVRGTIAVKTFRRLVRQSGIAVSSDELRPVFTGLMLEVDKEKITVVGTDTHRLAVGHDTWSGKGSTSVIVPHKVLQEVSRLAVGDEDNIIVTISKSQIFFAFANLIVTSRLIMGHFPDYHQVLPAEDQFTSTFSISRQRLIESLELATIISREISRGKGNIVRLRLDENSVNIYASTPDEGTFDENQEAYVTGEPLILNYNARYLLDVLKVIEEERVIFRLTGATTPGVVLPEAEEKAAAEAEATGAEAKASASKYLYLVLPVRVSK